MSRMVSKSPQHRYARMPLSLVMLRPCSETPLLPICVHLQVFHYATPGPVALRLDWNNMSFTFSGKLGLIHLAVCSQHISA